MIKDEDLYELYLNGDMEALESLVKLYSDDLVIFINRYINNTDESEDIMMNTFMSVMVHKKSFKGNSSFKTYLYSIARNKTIDFIRKKIKSSNEIIEVETESIETKVLKSERQKNIYDCLKLLPQRYSEILYFTYINDMSVDEISKLLNKNAKQIYNLNCRAKNRLKEVLEKEGYEIEIN